MATIFFLIGYHFEKFRSQVAIRKKIISLRNYIFGCYVVYNKTIIHLGFKWKWWIFTSLLHGSVNIHPGIGCQCCKSVTYLNNIVSNLSKYHLLVFAFLGLPYISLKQLKLAENSENKTRYFDSKFYEM